MTIKPRQQSRKAPARGKTSAGPMTPAKGKGSYKRSKADQDRLDRSLFVPDGFL